MAFSLRKAEITFIDLWPTYLTSLLPDDDDVDEAVVLRNLSNYSVRKLGSFENV